MERMNTFGIKSLVGNGCVAEAWSLSFDVYALADYVGHRESGPSYAVNKSVTT